MKTFFGFTTTFANKWLPTLAWVAVIGFWAKQQGSKLNDYARN
jgi:hypothetical protein